MLSTPLPLSLPHAQGGGPASAGSPSLSTPEPRPATDRPLTGPRGCPSSPARPRASARGGPGPPPRPRPASGSHRTWLAAATVEVLLLKYPFLTSPFLTQPFARIGRRQQQPPGSGRILPAAPGNRTGSGGGGCGGGGGGANSRSAPHPPLRNRKWLQRRCQFPVWPSREGGATREDGARQSPAAGGNMGRGLAAIDQSKGERGGSHADSGELRAREKRLADINGTSSEELEIWAFDWSPSQVVGGALPPSGPGWEGGGARKETAN